MRETILKNATRAAERAGTLLGFGAVHLLPQNTPDRVFVDTQGRHRWSPDSSS
ncbi:MAG: hypothetical protein MUC50_20195 [Myxococcota bacterium]|nr:hypothetical protein [Myxococcota bacterium]